MHNEYVTWQDQPRIKLQLRGITQLKSTQLSQLEPTLHHHHLTQDGIDMQIPHTHTHNCKATRLYKIYIYSIHAARQFLSRQEHIWIPIWPFCCETRRQIDCSRFKLQVATQIPVASSRSRCHDERHIIFFNRPCVHQLDVNRWQTETWWIFVYKDIYD